jgi:O-antigen ligase/cytochrome c-type biogenesis protein CcmH/NrfG
MLNKLKGEKIYLAIIEWGTYLALFTPMVFSRSFFFPFIVPKTVFFRIIVDILLIAYVFLVVANRKYLPKITPLKIAVSIFILVTLFTSLITGYNPAKSFWSVFERMTGILTFLHLFAFFVILTSVFREKKQWEKILTVSAIVGALICFNVWTSTEGVTRGGGSLGNTSFMAGYLLFNIFFTLILLLTKEGLGRLGYAALLIILVLGLFISQEPCRGAILALAIALVFLALGYLGFRVFTSGKNSYKKGFVVFIIALFLIGVGLLQTDYMKDKIQKLWDSSSIQSRIVVWHISWEGWKERFWLGWGEDNFSTTFSKHYDPVLPLTRDMWYDRAHNIVLDVGVSSGIVGLVSYLGIFAVATIGLLKAIPRLVNKRNVFFLLGMVALLISYFAQNIWVFDMISSYAMLFLSLAFIDFLAFPPKQEDAKEDSESISPFSLGLASLLILASLLAIFFGNIQPARASMFIIKGLSSAPREAIASFESALAASPISIYETPEQFSHTVINLAQTITGTEQNQAVFEQGFQSAEMALQKIIEKDPGNYRARLFLGEYYNNLYQVTSNTKFLDLAEDALKKSLEFSPRNQQSFWGLGQTMLFEKKDSEAIKYFQDAIALEPTFAQSHWFCFLAYKATEDYGNALKELKLAGDYGFEWKSNASNLAQVVDNYRLMKDNENVILYGEMGLAQAPRNAQLLSFLADAYLATGQKEKAKAMAERLLEVRPELKTQIEAFLKQLGY